MHRLFYQKSHPQFFPEPIVAQISSFQNQHQLRVAFQGSFYPARLHQSLSADVDIGQTCQVIGYEGITLLIQLS